MSCAIYRPVFVFDPLEARYWGPFEGGEEANAFIESDKYLESWGLMKTQLIRGLPVYRPAEYHGRWPVDDLSPAYTRNR